MSMLRLVVCLSIASVTCAQQLTIDAATPLVVSAQNAGTTSTQTLPAGPLPALGQLVASATAAQAHTGWQVQATPVALSFDLWQMAAVAPQATPPASASAGPHEYLLHLSSASAMNMLVSGHQWFDLLPGSPFPLVQVDVFDDGTIEFVLTSTQTGPDWGIAVVPVGPQPVPIRVRAANQGGLTGVGGSTHLHLSVTPNNLLDITTVASSCATNFLQCHPSFVGTGVDFWVGGAGSGPPVVLVLGLGLQPTVLPAHLGVPCLLVPSPDVLVLATSANALPFTLPLPPPVRPVTVYAQVVMVASQLLVTDAFRVSAY